MLLIFDLKNASQNYPPSSSLRKPTCLRFIHIILKIFLNAREKLSMTYDKDNPNI